MIASLVVCRIIVDTGVLWLPVLLINTHNVQQCPPPLRQVVERGIKRWSVIAGNLFAEVAGTLRTSEQCRARWVIHVIPTVVERVVLCGKLLPAITVCSTE